jgi:VIT1/CCC1 family predicted Fe2+/Mn2+ transporter
MSLALKMTLIAALPFLGSLQAMVVWGKSNAVHRFFFSRGANRHLWSARFLLAMAVLLGALLPLLPYSALLLAIMIAVFVAHLYLVSYKL